MVTDPTIANVTIFAGNYAPAGWLLCQGQLLNIGAYITLYTVIGTTYGGDGVQTFALPDFRGRVAVHAGQGAGLQPYILGQQGGVENVTLTIDQIPVHSHAVTNLVLPGFPASNLPGTTDIPTGNVPAQVNGSPAAYTTASTDNLGNSTTLSLSGSTGGNGTNGTTPINIVSPYTALNYVICVEGVFPTHD
jgi:microcystin-dependent protein